MNFGFNAITWIIFGSLLLFLETLLAGFYVAFLGASAIIIGILLLITQFPPDIQLYLFGVFSLALVFLAYKFKFYEAASSHKTLNEPQAALIGTIYTLDTPIESGRGTLKIGDSLWKINSGQISGENAPAGTKIKVVGYEKEVLLVEVLF